jgi:hypothetical protein
MASSKDRLAPLLVSIVEQLDVLNDGQAQALGHLEQIRESMHTLNNRVSVVATNSELDGKEIAKVLNTVDRIEKMLKVYITGIAAEAANESHTQFVEVEGPATARGKRGQ